MTSRLLKTPIRTGWVVGLSICCLIQNLSTVASGQEADAADAAEAPSGFLTILFSGGIVGSIMILILLLLSFTAAYLIFDHLMTIRRKDLMPEGLS